MPIKILVVDDNVELNDVICQILSSKSREISSAFCGEQCLTWLRQGNRGLIFLDIMMPGQNGWKVLQQIIDENLQEGNLICIFTAIPNSMDQAATFEKYIFSYLCKPFAMSDLNQIVDLYIKKISIGA